MDALPRRAAARLEKQSAPQRRGIRRRSPLGLLRGLLLLPILAADLATDARAEIPPAAREVLEQRCQRCHNAKTSKGDVSFERLSDKLDDPRAAETWHEALHALNRGDMPPEGEPLKPRERQLLVAAIRGHLDRLAASRRPASRVIRRLNRTEYQNTLRDLLGIDHDYIANLPPDERSPDGFTNHGASLRMSDLQLEFYLQAARRGLAQAIVEGEEPEVFEHRATSSAKDKGRGNWTNQLGRSGVFVARVPKFPDQGEFRLRVTARLVGPSAGPHPDMQIRLGYRADTQTPSRVVGVRSIGNREPQVFEFTGRLEEYPIQSRTQSKYPGMLVWIENLYDDGQPAPKARKKNKQNGQKAKSPPLDPTFPTIIINSLEFQAPVFASWPPANHARLIPKRSGDVERDAKAALQAFLSRAFRRDVGADDVAPYLDLFKKLRDRAGSFEAALRETMAAALISPEFLYLVEPLADPDAEQAKLNGFEIASRLSYMLWSTMPDDTLLQLARRGTLTEPTLRAEQVRRMLDDPRSEEFVRSFATQWLDLDGVDRVAVNPNVYPDFDLRLKAMMRQETIHYFQEVLRLNLPLETFLQSDFTMVNRQLAEHYGLGGGEPNKPTESKSTDVSGTKLDVPRGSTFQRVSLAGERRRGGLLTQGSVLLANSTGEDSHPIKRGVWIRDRLLNDPPAPPPPNVPNLDAGDPNFASLTVKQQLEAHLENDACADCHRGIDSWGVALEEFDAVGRFRSKIRRPSGKKGKFALHEVDSRTTLPNGTRVSGVAELQSHLREQWRSAFATALTHRLLSYALGRTLQPADEPAIRRITSQLREREGGLRDLIELVVASPSFIQR